MTAIQPSSVGLGSKKATLRTVERGGAGSSGDECANRRKRNCAPSGAQFENYKVR